MELRMNINKESFNEQLSDLVKEVFAYRLKWVDGIHFKLWNGNKLYNLKFKLYLADNGIYWILDLNKHNVGQYPTFMNKNENELDKVLQLTVKACIVEWAKWR